PGQRLARVEAQPAHLLLGAVAILAMLDEKRADVALERLLGRRRSLRLIRRPDHEQNDPRHRRSRHAHSPFGVPGIRRAFGSPGGLSSTRKLKRSAISCGFNCFSTSSGIKDSLLTCTRSISLRAITSCLPPCTLSTTRDGLSSTSSPVSDRPFTVSTVTASYPAPITRL